MGPQGLWAPGKIPRCPTLSPAGLRNEDFRNAKEKFERAYRFHLMSYFSQELAWDDCCHYRIQFKEKVSGRQHLFSRKALKGS